MDDDAKGDDDKDDDGRYRADDEGVLDRRGTPIVVTRTSPEIHC